MRRLLQAVLRRGGWGVADQAFSSLTNFAVGVVVAKLLGPRDFGAFSLAFASYLVVLGASRALSTEPLTIRYSHQLDRWRPATRGATGVAFALGAAAAVICALASALVGGAVGSAYLALAATLPGLLLQDAYRLSFFAGERGRSAFINDVVWASLLLPAFAVLIATQSVTVFTATFVWGATATGAGLFGLLQSRAVP